MKTEELRTLDPSAPVDGYYILNDVFEGRTAKDEPYLSGKLFDASGSLPFKFWNYQGQLGDLNDINGTIAHVKGTMDSYRGEPQVNVSEIERVPDWESNPDVHIEELVPTAHIDVDKWYHWLHEQGEKMEDEDYKKLYLHFLNKYEKEYRTLPAAKSVHHGFRSGLLMHTVNMMRLGKSAQQIYPYMVDRDLLLTGILLHDIAKKDEFKVSDLGLVTEYTTPGDLLGHLYMGAREVAKDAEKLGIPEDKSMLVEHMILSHHGKPEYGAVKVPQFAEAELLALIDNMDSTMEQYAENLPAIEPGGFSDRRLFGLGKRIYKPEKQ